MWVSLVVVLPLFWKDITCQPPGYSITVNSWVPVQEGLCVTIPCSFTADGRNTFNNSFGFWIRRYSKPYYIVATNNNSSDVQKSNFHLTGNPDSGNCALTITDAREEDEGTYYFRFEKSKYSKLKFSYEGYVTTTISVTDLTEEPVISDLGAVIAGINKTVTCAPPGNCPATSLVFQWKKSDVSGIWKNSPTITFTPSIDDHQKTITCEMTNSNWRTSQKTIVLHVYSLPAITITWETGKKGNKPDLIKVYEESSVTLKCSVQSDLTLNVTWTYGMNDILRRGIGRELELRLENMTMNQTGTYTCSALSDRVINSANISVIVQYPPRNAEITVHSSKVGERPASKQVVIDESETLTLVCRADGNPTSTVVWTKGECNLEESKMSNSVLSSEINVTSSMADVYRCLAWNALGFKERWIQVGNIQDCRTRTINSTIIIGTLIGIIVILIIIWGSYIFLKRREVKRQLGKGSPDPMTQGTESTYQELIRQKNDVYSTIKVQS